MLMEPSGSGGLTWVTKMRPARVETGSTTVASMRARTKPEGVIGPDPFRSATGMWNGRLATAMLGLRSALEGE